MRNTTTFITALIVFAGAIGAASARVNPRIQARGASVIINKRATVRFAGPNAGTSASERAEMVAVRLRQLVENGLSPADIQPNRKGRQWRVVVEGDSVLLYVTRRDAKASGTSPASLASEWAGRIRAALQLPPITLSATQITIPLGENRTVSVGGYADGPVSAHVKDEADHAVTARAEARRIVIHADQVGSAVVKAQVEDEDAEIEVDVKKYAGRVPKDLTAEITSNPAAPSDLVEAVAEEALRRAPTEPGAEVHQDSPIHGRGQIQPGESRIVTAKVTVQGSDYLPISGEARIKVTNVALPAEPVAKLYYSNTPEHIRAFQTLYSAKLSGSAPARLMFHHDNQMDQSVVLAVTLSNPTKYDLRVHILPGFVKPGNRPGHVGYRAGQVFWRNRMQTRGEICSLPANSVLPILLQRVDSFNTTSGIAQVRLIDPPAKAVCVLRVASEPTDLTGFPVRAQTAVDAWRYAFARPMTETESESAAGKPQTTYRAARAEDVKYVVGQHWTYVAIGLPNSDPARSPKEDWSANQGDYGVLYDINVHIVNPLSTAQNVEVDFGPSAGPAMGVFCIAGQYCDVGEVAAGDERSVFKITVQPHETRIVSIQTVPLGGSSYPANVIVH